MTKNILIFTVLGIYLFVVMIVGFIARKMSKEDTTEDYFLAGRTVGALTSFFTLTASFYSAYLLMGAVGFYYLHGFAMTMAIIYCSAYGFWYWVLGAPIHLLGKKYGHSTPADLIGYYYESKALGLLVAVVLCVFSIPLLAMQYTAIGMAFEMITDGAVNYRFGAVILGGIVCAYVFLGGFRAVAWTDIFQGIFFMAIAWILGIYFLIKEGGAGPLFEKITVIDQSLLSLPGPEGVYTWGVWLSCMLLYTITPALRPDTFQRAYAVNDLKSWKKACFHTTWVLPITYIITMFTAFGLRIHVPGLKGVEAEQALIAFFKINNPLIGIIILCAAVAAAMSTIDSMLLVTSQYLTEDFVKRINVHISDKSLKFIGQLFTIVLTVISVLTTFRPPEFMVMMTALFYGFSCIFWPMLGCIIWPRGTKLGSMACILTSCAIIVFLKFAGFGTYVRGIHFIVWGVYISGIVYIVTSLITSPPSDEMIENYHGYLRREFWSKFNMRSGKN